MSRSDFWSRRKAAVEAEAEGDAQALLEVEAEVQEAALAEKTDAEILEELGLPDPDTLNEGDDFKVFLAQTVPARIRDRALRRLWISNPVLANIDGLVDYGEDFTDASFLLGNLQTAYQVGKGMTAHVEELARQAEAEQTAADEPAPLEDELPAEADEPVPDAVPEDDLIAAAEPQPSATEETQEPELAAAPRRMRFVFDTPQQVSA
ncbi:DUF3306 domain-containing protein [Sulfitobacter mediterraneus]|uniref:Uncharacterized protein DUF3306 n=1 Tax=Sulfitobacter mediterraneus TaxID=83219 RepID=A0A2T6CFG2_9RHOB|nr:DUF3306 domain-containing protein [Sulfitobacter mediterraneus]KIN77819.1 DUF3306 domain containing protein [Sulfitobacter mediterraneus KCTC 32188]PTX74210.1 uncharacterized protein DUF3306 [Sulfitobacter mediterraneus]